MDPFTLSLLEPGDGNEVIDLFNYYVGHTFAAYPEVPVPYQFFTVFQQACTNYPSVVVRASDESLAGLACSEPTTRCRYSGIQQISRTLSSRI
jgi:L-amino acid N-acyltransferase YncA